MILIWHKGRGGVRPTTAVCHGTSDQTYGCTPMIGTSALLLETAFMLAPAAIVACMIWGHRRGVKTPFVAVFGFTVLAGLFALKYIREAQSITELQHLSRPAVSFISYKGRVYRDSTQVEEIVSALHQTQWYMVRASDTVDPQPLLVGFTDGRQWEMVIGGNRYGEGGTIMRLASREFTRGAAYNPVLNEVLNSR
jgi:hypothetical protein